jgi:hypothetical protein
VVHQPANDIALLPLIYCHWSNKLLNRPDKNALRAMLEAQVEEKLQRDPDAVTRMPPNLTLNVSGTPLSPQFKTKPLSKSSNRCVLMPKPECFIDPFPSRRT